MRRNKPSVFLSLLILMVFLAGLFLLLYPYLWGAVVDHGISLEAKDFLNRGGTVSPTGSNAIVTIDNTEPKVVDGVCENPDQKGILYRDGMVYIGNASRIIHTPAPSEQIPELGALVRISGSGK